MARLYVNGQLDATLPLPATMMSGGTTLEVGTSEQISSTTGQVEGIRFSNGAVSSFPYAAFAAIASEPTVIVGSEAVLTAPIV